jgi:hypothetical protein
MSFISGLYGVRKEEVYTSTMVQSRLPLRYKPPPQECCVRDQQTRVASAYKPPSQKIPWRNAF